jgi:hypothetical protein
VRVLVRVVQLPLAAPGLRAPQRQVRRAQQFGGVEVRRRAVHHADADRHRQPVAVHERRLGEFRVDVRHEGRDVGCRGRVLQQDAELVAVEPGDHGLLPRQHDLQALRDVHQQPVTRLPAQAVAHHAERVQVEVQERDAVLRVRAPQRGFQVAAEVLPVRQTGQHVVQDLALQLPLQQHQLGAVLHHDDEVARLVVGAAQQRGGQRDPRDLPVLAEQALRLADPGLGAVQQLPHRLAQHFRGAGVHEVEQRGAGQLGREVPEDVADRGVRAHQLAVQADDHDAAGRGRGHLVEARLALAQVRLRVPHGFEQRELHALLLLDDRALVRGEEADRQRAEAEDDPLGRRLDGLELRQRQQALAEHLQRAAQTGLADVTQGAQAFAHGFEHLGVVLPGAETVAHRVQLLAEFEVELLRGQRNDDDTAEEVGPLAGKGSPPVRCIRLWRRGVRTLAWVGHVRWPTWMSGCAGVYPLVVFPRSADSVKQSHTIVISVPTK